MIILALRTDNPRAELYLYDDGKMVGQVQWQAHRELSATIHSQLQALLKSHGKTMANLQGIVFYRGPGSFTGLRIGVSVANALASGLSIPVVASVGEDWLLDGLKLLQNTKEISFVEPLYGSDAYTTPPRK